MSNILIVDDNEEFRGMIKDYLSQQNLGIDIFEASSEETAIVKVSCMKPDVVIMDINLPKTNGLVLAKRIKEDCPRCGIIILTMFEEDLFKKMPQEADGMNFIGKSEIYDRLVPVVRKCLKSSG